MSNKALRNLPSVDSLLQDPILASAIQDLGREVVTDTLRKALDEARQVLLEQPDQAMSAERLYEQIMGGVEQTLAIIKRPAYRRVINATGIILHTGLGRAVLAEAALKQVQAELAGYSQLQVSTDTGKRSRRDGAIEQLLQKLTGCEAATVVNNNAAATAIVLNTMAEGKEVIVSRGQLVEIGGAFRLPDVMAFSGAKLVEVGTTNKTHARDYVNAITEDTAAILRVHPSNYQIMGFSSEVALEDMVAIAHDHGLALIDDVGAGSLVDMSRFGFAPEPTLPESIAAGSDIITSSADKLIGASQGGIILGRAKLVEAIRKNQFARIVRVDKMTLAVLEATLRLFLDTNKALSDVPTLRMVTRTPETLKEQAEQIAQAISDKTQVLQVQTIPGYSQTGSGSLPGQNLPTTCVAISAADITAESLSEQLRAASPPIFTRIQKDQILIDPRTLQDGDAENLIDVLIALGNKSSYR